MEHNKIHIVFSFTDGEPTQAVLLLLSVANQTR